jgi:hypothetical protein
MTSEDAASIVDSLFEEIDEDELLGSMLYCMTDGEKQRLKKKLIKRITEHDA